MQYKIVTVTDKTFPIILLEQKVNHLIQEGWKPIGGVSIVKPFQNLPELKVSQAMIKEN